MGVSNLSCFLLFFWRFHGTCGSSHEGFSLPIGCTRCPHQKEGSLWMHSKTLQEFWLVGGFDLCAILSSSRIHMVFSSIYMHPVYSHHMFLMVKWILYRGCCGKHPKTFHLNKQFVFGVRLLVEPDLIGDTKYLFQHFHRWNCFIRS